MVKLMHQALTVGYLGSACQLPGRTGTRTTRVAWAPVTGTAGPPGGKRSAHRRRGHHRPPSRPLGRPPPVAPTPPPSHDSRRCTVSEYALPWITLQNASRVLSPQEAQNAQAQRVKCAVSSWVRSLKCGQTALSQEAAMVSSTMPTRVVEAGYSADTLGRRWSEAGDDASTGSSAKGPMSPSSHVPLPCPVPTVLPGANADLSFAAELRPATRRLALLSRAAVSCR